MNRISRSVHVDATLPRAQSQEVSLGLTPRRLTELRKSIDALSHPEEPRVQLRSSIVRAALRGALIQACKAG
jgi:hypothetical protein